MNPENPTPRELLEARLTALLLGELPADEAAALREQLGRDADLRALHARLEQTIGLVRETVANPMEQTAEQPAPLRLSEERREKLLAQFKTVAPKEFARPKRNYREWVVPAAAAAALVVLAGVMLLPTLARTKSKSMRSYSMASVAAEAAMPETSSRMDGDSLAPRDGVSNVFSVGVVGYVNGLTTNGSFALRETPPDGSGSLLTRSESSSAPVRTGLLDAPVVPVRTLNNIVLPSTVELADAGNNRQADFRFYQYANSDISQTKDSQAGGYYTHLTRDDIGTLSLLNSDKFVNGGPAVEAGQKGLSDVKGSEPGPTVGPLHVAGELLFDLNGARGVNPNLDPVGRGGIATVNANAALIRVPGGADVDVSSTTLGGHVNTSINWNPGAGNADVPGYSFNGGTVALALTNGVLDRELARSGFDESAENPITSQRFVNKSDIITQAPRNMGQGYRGSGVATSGQTGQGQANHWVNFGMLGDFDDGRIASSGGNLNGGGKPATTGSTPDGLRMNFASQFQPQAAVPGSGNRGNNLATATESGKETEKLQTRLAGITGGTNNQGYSFGSAQLYYAGDSSFYTNNSGVDEAFRELNRRYEASSGGGGPTVAGVSIPPGGGGRGWGGGAGGFGGAGGGGFGGGGGMAGGGMGGGVGIVGRVGGVSVTSPGTSTSAAATLADATEVDIDPATGLPIQPPNKDGAMQLAVRPTVIDPSTGLPVAVPVERIVDGKLLVYDGRNGTLTDFGRPQSVDGNPIPPVVRKIAAKGVGPGLADGSVQQASTASMNSAATSGDINSAAYANYILMPGSEGDAISATAGGANKNAAPVMTDGVLGQGLRNQPNTPQPSLNGPLNKDGFTTFPGNANAFYGNSTLLAPAITDGSITQGLRTQLNAPTIATATGILTDPQFRPALQALDQRDGVDVLTAPEVTTESGRQSQMQAVNIQSIVTGSGLGFGDGATTVTTGGAAVAGAATPAFTPATRPMVANSVTLGNNFALAAQGTVGGNAKTSDINKAPKSQVVLPGNGNEAITANWKTSDATGNIVPPQVFAPAQVAANDQTALRDSVKREAYVLRSVGQLDVTNGLVPVARNVQLAGNVHYVALKNANPQDVQQILKGLFPNGTTTGQVAGLQDSPLYGTQTVTTNNWTSLAAGGVGTVSSTHDYPNGTMNGPVSVSVDPVTGGLIAITDDKTFGNAHNVINGAEPPPGAERLERRVDRFGIAEPAKPGDLAKNEAQTLLEQERRNRELKQVESKKADQPQVNSLVQDGKLYYEAGKYEEADAKFKQALKLDPANLAASQYNALILEKRNLNVLHSNQIASNAPAKVVQIEDRPEPRIVAPPLIPQPEVLVRENAFSTFSLNVSDVAFKLAGASLEKGLMPDSGTVRSEEFINAFDYRDPAPPPGAPIGFAFERARYPFAHNRDLLRFAIKTAAAGREPGRPLNIVLLLDNSGSMERADRVAIIREALRVLASELQPQDKLSVVTFARTARLWVDGIAGSEAGAALEKAGELTPEGGTNLEEAMRLAYETALRHYLANGVNRVVLLTDGAANLGNVDPAMLKQQVELNRKQGVALDCFGIGWEGYNDDLLETLSRNGDGRYGFINTPGEAATEFAGQLAGAFNVAASDVKVQVEFNPKRAVAYRQIGYAKHQLTKEQFRDNTVNAAQIAAEESGNALYTVEVNPQGEGPVCTVRVRYRVPNTQDYREQAWDVPYNGAAVAMEQASPAMRLAATAGAFSEWLAASPFAAEVEPDRLLGLLNGVPEVCGADARPKKLEAMIRQAKAIAGK